MQHRETIRHSQAEFLLCPHQVTMAVKWLLKSHRIQLVKENERGQKNPYNPQYYSLLSSFGQSGIVLLALCHLASLGKQQRVSRKLGRDKSYYSTFLSFPHEYVWSELCLTLDGSQGLIDYSITLQDSICCCRLTPGHIECSAGDLRERQEAGSTGCWKDYKQNELQ